MDHSFSIDTCLYSKDDLSTANRKSSIESFIRYATEGSINKQIEQELGTTNNEELKSENKDDRKFTILKKCLDNLSKTIVSDTLSFLKEYFQIKDTFEYSVHTSIDTFHQDLSKVLDDSDRSQTRKDTFETNDLPSVDRNASKTCSIHPVSETCSIRELVPESEIEYELDPETLEKALLVFVDYSHKLATKAVEDNRHLFADKLICNIFRRLKQVYDRNYDNNYTNSLDSTGRYPLFNLSFNLPSGTPKSVRIRLEEMSKDPLFVNNLAERIIIFDIMNRFKMFDLTELCFKFNQRIIEELWHLSVHSVFSKTNYDVERLFQCRNSIFTTENADKFLYDKNLSSKIESFTDANLYPQVSVHSNYETKESNLENLPDLNSDDMSQDLNSPWLSYDSSRTFRDLGSSRDKWPEGLFVGSHDTLNYILRTNRLLNYERIDLLKGHFNLRKTEGSGFWVKETNKPLETFYFLEKNCVSIKVRGKLPCDIITALTIISQTELRLEWVSFLKDSQDLHTFSKTSRISRQASHSYIIRKYEYPVVGHKESLVYALSTNLLDEANCVIICCCNPPSNKKEFETVVKSMRKSGLEDTSGFISLDSKNNCTLSRYNISSSVPKRKNQKSGDICFLLFPYGENETLMEVYGNVTQEVKLVPMKFITFLIKKIMVGMIRKLANISKGFSETKFAQSMSSRSEFYDWMVKIYRDQKGSNPQLSTFDYDNYVYTYNPIAKKS
ncbi:uncharacterized protein TA17040 [Theileria annulata]|uniref:Uncharacterized protein n=1 Tax=Theileria annulata TaxID=5874 RepID=Q4UIP6_THEAN|nr:uncharacterized protein TA17040 [Theileria annulata]CAI73043.1 hypothetical protein, conserved [Theileria annulata]|eukprot:XP_953721.1 hypothetical protein, conserved [Theileria annulata]